MYCRKNSPRWGLKVIGQIRGILSTDYNCRKNSPRWGLKEHVVNVVRYGFWKNCRKNSPRWGLKESSSFSSKSFAFVVLQKEFP